MVDTPLFRLDDRVVIIVGAASGIGEAVARACARQGAIVVAADVNGPGAEGVAASVRDAGGRAEAHVLDIRDAAAVHARFDEVAARLSRLDGVVCTPSINVRKPLLAYAEEELDRVIDVNLKGTFNVLRAAGRLMTARARGSIVLLSSIRAQVVEPGQGVYAATKAGILQMARAAAAEYGPSGVRVNAVAPGVTETPLTAAIKANADWYRAYAAKSVFNRWATADEIAGPIVFLLSDAASYVTGSLLVVDGGWLAADGRFTPPGM
jgi:NAD(P)-dependent dehydrogenase (short-subunit alcohol dehydrogenase family)